MAQHRYADVSPPSTVLGIVNILLKRFGWVAFFGFGTGIAAIVVTSLMGPRFVATSSFVPKQAGPNVGGLSALAAQMGVSLSAPVDATPSIWTYREVLLSRDVLLAAATSPYRVEESASTGTATLIEVYGLSTDPMAVQKAVERLERRTSVTVDLDANMLTLETTAPSAELAEQINRRLLELTVDFNLRKRQIEAGAERTFLEERLPEVREELDQAERNVENFQAQNRRYQDSPELQLEFTRLQRRVTLQEQVYVTLLQAREEARLEEMRNTPVVTMIETPEGGAREIGGKARNGVLGGILGGLFGVMLALILEYGTIVQRNRPEDMTEFRRLKERFRLRTGPLRRSNTSRGES